MAKVKHKAICDHCHGNGYIRMVLEEGREEAIFDCNTCNNQGEIEITEPTVEELNALATSARLQ